MGDENVSAVPVRNNRAERVPISLRRSRSAGFVSKQRWAVWGVGAAGESEALHKWKGIRDDDNAAVCCPNGKPR